MGIVECKSQHFAVIHDTPSLAFYMILAGSHVYLGDFPFEHKFIFEGLSIGIVPLSRNYLAMM